MKIGIDAKWYFSGPPSGVNVVRNLVDAFIEFNKEDEICFFLSNRDVHLKEQFIHKINGRKNISFIFIPGKVNFFTNLILFPFYFFNKKFDLILFQNYIPIWGGYKTKYFNYVHDFLFLDYPQYFSNIEKCVYRLMLYSVKKAHHVITISQSERNRIINHSNININEVSYVYHGLDTIFYERSDEVRNEIKAKYGLPENFILYVGRINIRKNIETLLKSFSEMSADISLVIIGKEENKGFSIEKEITKLGIKERVYIIGYVANDALAEIMSAATIFVFPSYAEGFGLPPLEAMKSGIPTIVSNATALPEVCGNAALTFNPHSSSELVTKMDFLLNNSEAYNDFKLRGLNRASEFSWKNTVALITAILKNKIT